MLVTQSCPTLYNPIDCSLPGSSIHVVLQARTLEWITIPFPRGSSQPRDQIQVSCKAGTLFNTEPPGKPGLQLKKKKEVILIEIGYLDDIHPYKGMWIYVVIKMKI